MARGRLRLPAADAEAMAVMAHLRAQPEVVRRIAAALGVSTSAVWAWKAVPLERVVQVEIVTGVPRETLRPDFHLPVLDLKRAG